MARQRVNAEAFNNAVKAALAKEVPDARRQGYEEGDPLDGAILHAIGRKLFVSVALGDLFATTEIPWPARGIPASMADLTELGITVCDVLPLNADFKMENGKTRKVNIAPFIILADKVDGRLEGLFGGYFGYDHEFPEISDTISTAFGVKGEIKVGEVKLDRWIGKALLSSDQPHLVAIGRRVDEEYVSAESGQQKYYSW